MTEEPLTTPWRLAKPVLLPALVFMTRDASTLLRCLAFFMQEGTTTSPRRAANLFTLFLYVPLAFLEKR